MNRFMDSIHLGKFLGLALAAEELRGKQPDAHFVETLIAFGKEYRDDEAKELRTQLLRGDTITNLEEIVEKRITQ